MNLLIAQHIWVSLQYWDTTQSQADGIPKTTFFVFCGAANI
jgi:hypothetical protein